MINYYNNKEITLHTPSAPTVESPASATDPRYSTSGILNAEIKEKYRQGMMSNYSGRTGNYLDINKFANIKNERKDPIATSILEKLSALYKDVADKSNAAGVGKTTHGKDVAKTNIQTYNESVDAVNNFLKSYDVENSNVVKAGRTHNYDKRIVHDDDYAAINKGEINESVKNLGKSGDVFNEVATNVKKRQQTTAK